MDYFSLPLFQLDHYPPVSYTLPDASDTQFNLVKTLFLGKVYGMCLSYQLNQSACRVYLQGLFVCLWAHVTNLSASHFNYGLLKTVLLQSQKYMIIFY